MTLFSHRTPRLLVERALDGATLELDEHDAHYLGHVLRLRVGEHLVAFDGRGNERCATVLSLQRRGATLELGAAAEPLPESPLDLTLVQALPKSDAMDLIVQKASELGVRTLVPVYSEFSVVRLDAERSERRTEHWRKIVRSACEQCGRHRPMTIAPPAPLGEALAGLEGSATRLALETSASRPLAAEAAPAAGLVVAVGPEGGFGTHDLSRLDSAGFQRVALGRRVLRAETAAIAVCAIAQATWGDLGKPA
jgi:16S rRNA (uracil1498-N3)-methyltransferase